MPINPNIILGVRQPELAQSDPTERMGRILGIQNAVGQQDIQRLQLQQAKQGIDDENALREAYQTAGGDNTRLRALLGERGQYKALQALDKFELERREKDSTIGKNTAQQKKAEWDVASDKISRVSSILSTAKDQPSYDSARRLMAVQFPEIGSAMPEQYNAQFVQQQIAQGQTIAQRLQDLREQEKIKETGRHNLQTESNTVRGQNITRDTTQRGQDMTDSRERDVGLAGRRAQSAAAGRELGEAEAKAITDLPRVTANAERALSLVDNLIGTKGKVLGPKDTPVAPHAGFEGAIGATVLPGARFVPGTDAADFQARLDEIKGGAFLEAFNSLRGGGAITEKEGEKATQSITRMSNSQSEAEFVKAAREFQDVVRAGLKKAREMAQGQGKVGGVLTKNPDGSFNYGK